MSEKAYKRARRAVWDLVSKFSTLPSRRSFKRMVRNVVRLRRARS